MDAKDPDPWKEIGGGAVNEKRREGQQSSSVEGFDPESKSHLMHAVEGLSRYPNYLSRWNNVEEINALEKAFENQLEKVRKQKEAILTRREGIGEVVALVDSRTDPSILKLLKTPPADWSEIASSVLNEKTARAIVSSKQFKHDLTPSVEQVVGGEVDVDLDVARLQEVMDEEMFDVYSFDLLSLSFCSVLRQYVQDIIETATSNDKFKDLELGRRPVDLDTIGLSWINDLLFNLIVKPISRHLFVTTECGGKDLDWRQVYIAGYSARPSEGRPRKQLVTHTDDSEVTLNVCIGDDFEGGRLQFHGLRGTQDAGQLNDEYCPKLGRAIIHAGRHFHHVTDVTKGERYALIMWARSWQGVRSQTCPCCWLNRRGGEDCTCGPSWN